MAKAELSRTGVFNICHRFAAEGAKGLVSKPRGRKPGEQRWLDPAQEAEIQALIRRHTPDELGLPFVVRPDAETVGCAVQAAKGRLAGGHGARPRCSARTWFGVR